MMKRLLTAALLALSAACQVSHPTFYQWGSKAGDANSNETADQTPGPARDAQPIGDAPKNQVLNLSVHVGLRNESELDAFLEQATDPQSPKYGQFLSHDEFAARYLPTPQQMQAVRDALRERGLTVDDSDHGPVVYAKASVAEAERAFNVRLSQYEDRENRRTVRAPTAPITLPPGLGIISVHGLATPPSREPHHILAPVGREARGGALTPYKAASVRSAYNVPAALDGEGAVIGMLELDGYKASDIQAYATQNHIGMPKLTNINLGRYDGHILSGGAQLEVTLDIELAMAFAPKAAEIVVYAADQTRSDTAWFDIWNEMANPTKHPLVRTISVSWGTPENYAASATKNSENAILKQMAAQGQSVFVASGDNGAYDDGAHLVTDDPASQYYAIAVGGTRVTLNPQAQRTAEKTWANAGGGLSGYWSAPSWQKSAAADNSAISTRLRNVPDVSLNADPATSYAVYMNGRWTGVGGTSASTPLWAAYWESIQRAREKSGLAPYGFAAPVLWSLRGAGMHDIADNSSNGHYHAKAGYDHGTGWGTIDGQALYNALVPAPLPTTSATSPNP